MKTYFNYTLILLFSILIISCGDDDEGSSVPTNDFQAIITLDTFDINDQIIIEAGTEVVISAENSIGIEGATVRWTANTPYDINSSGQFFSETDNSSSDAVLSFQATRSGSYNFFLELVKNGRISQSGISFVVEGALEISTVNDLEDLTFKNLDGQFDENIADYIINSDFIIPVGTNVQFENGVTIRFAEDVAFDVQGTLSELVNGSSIYLIGGDSNWKGMRVEGTFTGGATYIYSAGSSSFNSNPDDAGALLIEEGATFNSPNGTYIKDSKGYALNSLGVFEFNFGSTGFVQIENSTKSMKLPAVILSTLQAQITPSDYEHVEIYSTINQDELFYQLSSLIGIQRIRILDSLICSGLSADNADIIMNPLSYIKSTSNSIQASNTVFRASSDNLADAWIGIKSQGSSIGLSGSQISNAGVGFLPGLNISTSLFLDNNSSLEMTNSTITDNNGSGITCLGIVADMRDNTFSNNNQYHLGMSYYNADELAGNTFDNTANAVEFVSSNAAGASSVETIPSLGTGNFYVSRVDMVYPSSELQLLQGVHIKMDLNTYINVSGDITATGSQSNPIIIEGLQNSNGYWQGLGFGLDANMTFVDILDGGRLDGAGTFGTQFAGGLVVQAAPNRSVSINDCNVSNAGQYGAVIKFGAGDFDIDSTIYNNTFQGSLGSVFDEN